MYCYLLQIPFKIKNFSISNCKDQLIDLENILVATGKKGNLVLSGTLISKTDLESPIQVSINLLKINVRTK